MYACDFEYDGRLLSSYGFVLCQFGGDGSLETSDTGFDITFTKVKRNRGRKHSIVNTQYEECVQYTFQICKNPDDIGDGEITNIEYREMARWLNRHEFLPFRVIGDYDDEERPLCYFNASFDIDKLYINDRLYGLQLTMNTDAPFGYGRKFNREYDVLEDGVITVMDTNDDIGLTAPHVTVTCHDDGDLIITNNTYSNVMRLNNCVDGEVLNFDGDLQIVTSSVSSHKVYNDFNYEFLKIGNDRNGCANSISVSLPCTIRISYAPIIKDIP